MHGLTSQVKAYEQLTIRAAVEGNEVLAMQALLSNPLGPDALHVEEVWHDLRRTNASWIDQLFGTGTAAPGAVR
jgi:6-phospho-beta-glucosidase